MNEIKFTDCLKAYLEHCSTSSWIKDESYKFYFANWLSRKVVLKVQDTEKILNYCKEALRKDYSLNEDLSRIGVQFLQKSGRKKLSIPIILSDVEIIKYLAENDIPDESFFKQRGTSYPGLSCWLGTLIPEKFMPVGTTDFQETVCYLFDLENLPKAGYNFFIETKNISRLQNLI